MLNFELYSERGKKGRIVERMRANTKLNGPRNFVKAYATGDPNWARPYMHVVGNKEQPLLNVDKRVIPVANATLRKDEWKEYDQALLEAAKLRLVGVGDLLRRGLNYTVANGYSRTVLEYEDVTELDDAEMNMDGLTRANNDRIEYELKYLPLPIIHKHFQINDRVLQSSRNTGSSLDVQQGKEAAFKVAEFIENMLFNGPASTTYAYGGGTIYGYTNFPKRITGSLTGNWDALTENSLGTQGEQILADVLSMKQDAIDKRHFGPFVLYIPTAYETVLDKEFTTGYAKSIRERLLQIASLEDILVIDKLTANNVVLAQVTSNVIRMVTAMPMTNVEWSQEGGMVHNFKVMAIQIPQPRADANNNTGIVHYT